MSRLVVCPLRASTGFIFRLISTSIAYLCLLFIYRFLENIGEGKKGALKSRRSGNKMWLNASTSTLHITRDQGTLANTPVPTDTLVKPCNICKHQEHYLNTIIYVVTASKVC